MFIQVSFLKCHHRLAVFILMQGHHITFETPCHVFYNTGVTGSGPGHQQYADPCVLPLQPDALDTWLQCGGLHPHHGPGHVHRQGNHRKDTPRKGGYLCLGAWGMPRENLSKSVL